MKDVCVIMTLIFSSKHMDKHDRPYRCQEGGCEKLPGFTYSGGLLRHEREVHGKHGGPRKQLNCPHPNCKRFTGKGFSRQENLNEHLRRVHTDTGVGQVQMQNSQAQAQMQMHQQQHMLQQQIQHQHQQEQLQPQFQVEDNTEDDLSALKTGQKRQRVDERGSDHRGSDAGDASIHAELKRVKEENENLHKELAYHRLQTQDMQRQIADLQLAAGLNTQMAPQASM